LVFVGIDWSEKHHDICIVDREGEILAKDRVKEGIEGIARLHALVAEHADEPEDAVIGIETDRGLLVGALASAGYQVFAINPLSVDRYRHRHATSGAKSDPGDAKVLADIVRTDRHNHRPIAGDTELAEAIKLLARAHQGFVWERQRHVNRLRNALREFYPQALEAFGTALAASDAGRGAIDSSDPRSRPASVAVQDRQRIAEGRSPAKRRGARGANPGGTQVRAATGTGDRVSRLRDHRGVAGGADRRP
jgi:transposase